MAPPTRHHTSLPAALHFRMSLQQNWPGRITYYFTGFVRSERTAVSLRLQALSPQRALRDVPVPQVGAEQALFAV